jgi:[glutamine synthetase] adenylyltransferase / [glutamine synthetase]-adenylyl-L-tyrosine phosphorylase
MTRRRRCAGIAHCPMPSKNRVWPKTIEAAADPRRVRHFLDELAGTTAMATVEQANPEQARILAALFSGSPAMSNRLVANPEWIQSLDLERLKFPRRAEGVRQELNGLLQPLLAARDFKGALAALRHFKQREMLRIATRDLAQLGNTPETIREISNVADACLSVVARICLEQLTALFGRPHHQAPDAGWQPTDFCVLGLGKLGGQELNYSSDVDLLFVYRDEGRAFKEPPGPRVRPGLANHQFFSRLAEAFIAEVSRMAPEGMLYRIDLRLRPEGSAGPLCRSLESYENYYAQWGQTWERMMLIKARPVAGNAGLAGEFLEMIHPFRYPRAIGADVPQEIGAMKDRIENEVLRTGEIDRNVKLGRGGIREIEFIAQSQQLLHAGRLPFLQGAQTLPTLEKLAQYDLLGRSDARTLYAAYCFLRDVEHHLQMDENLQTHSIPVERSARERLARLMGIDRVTEFDRARRKHTDTVRTIFDRILKSGSTTSQSDLFPADFDGREKEWRNILAAHGFRDPEKALRSLREFVGGPGYVHVSPRIAELARGLMRRLFALCPHAPRDDSNAKKHRRAPQSEPTARNVRAEDAPPRALSDPDRVVMRLDSFIAAYGARPVLFELWHGNPDIFELLLLLFDRSEFLAELAIRTPDMVDSLVTSGRLRQRKSSAETLHDLQYGAKDADQPAWLRRYQQTELMRIGLRDILNLADFEQYLAELSALADACLQYALEVVMRKHGLAKSPLAIIGLGKLGGTEIDYGSDLDLLFVTTARPGSLPKLQALALEVIELISKRTESGLVFQTDTRLRPDGEKGLLVNTLDAYEEYSRRRAHLWEIQTLTRTRFVAGDERVGHAFQNLAAKLTDFSNVATPDRRAMRRRGARVEMPACYKPDWKRGIHEMRLRIQRERTPAGRDELAIKTGTGGLMDAEFIAQALCLERGWQEANTLRALGRGHRERALPDAKRLIANYRHLRRVEGILRRWSYEGEVTLPADPAPYYRVSVRCGYRTPEAFRAAVNSWRHAIREVYDRFFGVPENNRARNKP